MAAPQVHSSNKIAPFVVEQIGIAHIEESTRWASPRTIGALWAGSSINVEYFVYGALLMGFGFSFLTAVSLILIGNLSFFLVGIASLQGPEAGTTTFTINRAAFGTKGSKVLALLNWVTLIGFEVEGLILIVGAALVLFQLAGMHVGGVQEVALIIGASAIQAILPYFGHATMAKVLRMMIIPFIAMYVLLSYFGVRHGVMNFNGVSSGWQIYSAGLAFVFALSGLGWTNCGNDYSRYVARDVKKRELVGWIFLGTAVPEIILMLLGATTFTFLSSNTQIAQWNGANPFQALYAQNFIPSWCVAAFLMFAILQLFAVNSLDLYSSGVSLQAVGIRIKRYQAVLLDSSIACTLTVWAMFQSTFSLFMKEFVGVIIVWIGPWLGIFLVDWILRKYKYNASELQRTDVNGIYYGSAGGWNWNAAVAFFTGMVSATLCFSKAPPPVNFPFHWMTPISNHFNGADFSAFAGVLISALVYTILEKVSGYVARQNKAQLDLELTM